ncbi:MAG: ZIP family metal transporter [Steroidobacter sp.]
MTTILWIILATVLGGVLSALAASLFLIVPEKKRIHWIPHLVSFAIGALLAAALLDLLPEAISTAGVSKASQIGLTLLVGLLIFFVLEKLVLWRHCHHDMCEGHQMEEHHSHQDQQRHAASGWMILFGDGLHNMLDGVLIAAAFMTDVHLGVVTSLAVMIHEIPQEVGDLAILLHSGMSRHKALLLNLVTSLTSVVGGVVAFFALGTAMHVLPYAITLASASFIYIAVADLIPGLHRRVDPESAVQQFALISCGVLLIGLMEKMLR